MSGQAACLNVCPVQPAARTLEKEKIMEVRLAVPADLPQLEAVYQKIIRHMDESGVPIWDEVYPCALFAADVEARRLYIVEKDGRIAGAFALCDSSAGAGCVEWKEPQAKAFYIDRLGVSVEHRREGLGSVLLRRAAELARAKGACWLRLFVVDINRPAMELYVKNGFQRAGGVYEEKIAEDMALREFGFELGLCP